MQKPGSSLPQRSLRELLFLIVASGASGIRLSPSLVLLDFREITADLVHRLAYNSDVAAGQLAVFQGASEAPISELIRVERATRKNSQPAAAQRGPPGQLADFQGGLSRTGGNDEHIYIERKE